MTFAQWRFGFPDAPAGTATSAGPVSDMFIGWLNLADSDGGKLANYRLSLHPSAFSWSSGFFATWIELFYELFLIVGAHAVALQEVILNPNAWLEPLSNLYGGITGKVYGAIPPVALATGAFGILAFIVYVRRGSAGSATQVSKEQWSRLSSGVLLLGLVAILAANPFRVIRQALDWLLGLASFFTRSGEGGVGARVHSANVDIIRSLTFMMNYRGELSAECARVWSTMINTGAANPGCLTAEQLAGRSPNAVSVFAAVLAVVFALAMLYFVGVVAVYLFNQVGLTIVYLTGLVYIAVGAMLKRRPYDPLSRTLARAGVHGLLALGYWFVAALIPGLLILVASWAQALPTWIPIALMAVVYCLVAQGIRRASKNHETLYKLFRDRIERSNRWKVFYSESGPTVAGAALQGTWEQPKAWVMGQYHKTRDAVTDHWNRYLQSGRDDEGTPMTPPAILADNPEFAAALTRADTYVAPPGERAATVHGNDVTAPAALGRVIGEVNDAAGGPNKVVVVEPGGRVAVGRPAELSDLTLPISTDLTGALPPVFFRAGIPQLAPPLSPLPPAQPAPDAPTSAAGADGVPPALADFADTMNAHWRRIDAMTHRFHDEAAALNQRRNGDAGPDHIEVGAAVFRGSAPGDHTVQVTAPSPVDQVRAVPALRSILDSAARAQRLTYNRNLLRARGVTAPLTIADEDESAQQLVFAADRLGRIRPQPRFGRGFGDAI